jgi:hypothetical protein
MRGETSPHTDVLVVLPLLLRPIQAFGDFGHSCEQRTDSGTREPGGARVILRSPRMRLGMSGHHR